MTLFNIFKSILCIDPFTITIATVGSAIGAYYLSSKDNVIKENVKKVVKRIGQKLGYFEGCEDFWIPGNMEGILISKTVVPLNKV